MVSIFERWNGSSIEFGLDGLIDDALIFQQIQKLILVSGGSTTLQPRESLDCRTVFLDLRQIGSIAEESSRLLPDTYHYQYVHDCIHQEVILDLRPYRVQRDSIYGNRELKVLLVVLKNWSWYDLTKPEHSNSCGDVQPITHRAEVESRLLSLPAAENRESEDQNASNQVNGETAEHSSTDVSMEAVASVDNDRSESSVAERSIDDENSDGGDNMIEVLRSLNRDRCDRGQSSVGRNKFTTAEDIDILEFITDAHREMRQRKEPAYAVKGRRFWKQTNGILPPSLANHTPFSLWTRFVKHILPNLQSYTSCVDVATLIKVAELAQVDIDSIRAGRDIKETTSSECGNPEPNEGQCEKRCSSVNQSRQLSIAGISSVNGSGSTPSLAGHNSSRSAAISEVSEANSGVIETADSHTTSPDSIPDPEVPFVRRSTRRSPVQNSSRGSRREKRRRRRLFCVDSEPLMDEGQSDVSVMEASVSETPRNSRNPPVPARKAGGGRKKREETQAKSFRAPYTRDEDIEILRFFEQCPHRISVVGGRAIWQEMENHFNGARTWQSLKNRFIRNIMPCCTIYTEVSPAFLEELEKRCK